MAFDRPELVARFFTFCLFWAVEISPGVSWIVCGGRFITLASGVAARWTKLVLLDGWKGAVVGKIREAGFAATSSVIPICGCACGRLKPGGIEGVDVLDTLS